MTNPRFRGDVNDDINWLDSRQARLERQIQRPHAKMTWNGSAGMTINVTYGVSAAGGQTSLGIVPTAVFDSTADPYESDGDMLDLVNGRIIAPVSGLYLGIAQAAFSPLATAGARAVGIRSNSNPIGKVGFERAGGAGAGNSTFVHTSGFHPLDAGGFFEVTVFQNVVTGLALVDLVFMMAMIAPVPYGL